MKTKINTIILLLILAASPITNEAKSRNILTTNDMTHNNEQNSSTTFQDTIGARDLHSAFAKNDSDARHTYTGKTITVTGIAVSAGPDSFGLPSVGLSDKANGKTYALCLLPVLDYLKLRNVSKGDELTISGECRYIGGDNFVVMKHCKILK